MAKVRFSEICKDVERECSKLEAKVKAAAAAAFQALTGTDPTATGEEAEKFETALTGLCDLLPAGTGRSLRNALNAEIAHRGPNWARKFAVKALGELIPSISGGGKK